MQRTDVFEPSNKLGAIAVLGPTASGKSALGFLLANSMPIEIISLDSALVFKDMNIGTAKPSAEELALVPHHLIDVISPEQVFNASDFVEACHRLIVQIRGRGRVPIILGGTMMYFKALIGGLDDMPKTDFQVRTSIERQAVKYGWPELHKQLAGVDPFTASRLKPNDSQRISRALEVFQISGRPISDFQKNQNKPRYELPTLALLPSDRSQLHGNIANRFQVMLKQGLIEEVRELKHQYNLQPQMPSMRCVGYRQVWAYLDNQDSYETMIDKGIVATRQLAKRQLTWLRSFRLHQTFDPFQAGWQQPALKWLENQIIKLEDADFRGEAGQ